MYMDNNKTLLTILVIFVLISIVSFYVAFDKIATLGTTVSNLELVNQIKNKLSDTTTNTPAPSTAPATTDQSTQTSQLVASATDVIAKISTAIIFDVNSSSTLLPQASTTITIENVSKLKDGTLTADIKAFTSNASSYTAIDPKSLFWIINVDGSDELATDAKGQFSSMPPKSSVSVQVIFKPTSDRNSYIFQVGTGDDTKFYEFDFAKKSYKETIIG